MAKIYRKFQDITADTSGLLFRMRKNKQYEKRSGIPVIASVDVLVFGSSVGAVTSALSAQERGKRTYVVSDRPYFGAEFAGTLDLWLDSEPKDPLLKSIVSGEEKNVLRPGAIKHGLERKLLEQKIPFLFLTRPVAILRDRNGKMGGAVLASRTSLYLIKADAIVDATRGGLAAQLAGDSRLNEAVLPASASLTVVTRNGEGEEGWRAVGNPWRATGGPSDKDAFVHAYQIPLVMPSYKKTVAGVAPLEHLLRCQAGHSSVLYSAEALRLSNSRDTGASDPLAFSPDVFRVEEGLFVIGGTLPLNREGQHQLELPDVQAALGRKVGELAAEGHRASAGKELAIHRTQDAGVTETSYRFAEPFVRDAEEWIDLDFPPLPLLGTCDVAVAGGGTGGAAAGIAAARAGAKTVVLDVQRGLGGVGTLGVIACYWFGNRVGFTEELDRSLAKVDSVAAEKKSSWSPEAKMSWYHQTLKEAGGEAWLGSFAFGVELAGNKISGMLVSTPYGCGVLKAGSVVDATGNADVAAAAGAPCRVINGRHSAVQGTGLSPRRLGTHYTNTDFTFVDDCDVVGVTHAFVNARAKFTSEFDTIPMVDTRERRQIIGEIELSPLDFLAGRRFSDVVVTAMSNFDTHGYTVHPIFTVTPPDKKPLYAHVPFRCLLPQKVEGVIVTGLGISAHRDAIPVVRMQADVQNQGYAAGVAAAMVAAKGGTFREIDFGQLQDHLIKIGILAPEARQWTDDFPMPLEKVKQIASEGPSDLFHTAVLFAHPEQSAPLLLAQLVTEVDAKVRERCALVLGLMGRPEAYPVLAEIVQAEDWDEGWDYKGMGQFGQSMSRLDSLIIALGNTRNPKASGPIRQKISSLPADARFSHCRAVALASASLNDAALSKALAELLRKPGVQGHAQVSTASVLRTANNDPEETAARSLALRELHLARGIYLTGDCDGLGTAILRAYSGDLRGAFARHATAVLAETDLELLRAEGC